MSQKKKMQLTGGCFCKRVRYKLLQAPMFVNCCHCTECQNQTGTAFVINALIETTRLKKLRGKLEVISMSPKNDSPHDIYRCAKCKVAVWSDYGRRTWIRFVRVGTFDKPQALKPMAHIFTRSKLPWVKIPKNQPQFKIYYDMGKLWSRKSLERRSAASNS